MEMWLGCRVWSKKGWRINRWEVDVSQKGTSGEKETGSLLKHTCWMWMWTAQDAMGSCGFANGARFRQLFKRKVLDEEIATFVTAHSETRKRAEIIVCSRQSSNQSPHGSCFFCRPFLSWISPKFDRTLLGLTFIFFHYNNNIHRFTLCSQKKQELVSVWTIF